MMIPLPRRDRANSCVDTTLVPGSKPHPQHTHADTLHDCQSAAVTFTDCAWIVPLPLDVKK